MILVGAAFGHGIEVAGAAEFSAVVSSDQFQLPDGLHVDGLRVHGFFLDAIHSHVGLRKSLAAESHAAGAAASARLDMWQDSQHGRGAAEAVARDGNVLVARSGELGADFPLLGFDGGGDLAHRDCRIDTSHLKGDVDSVDLTAGELDIVGYEPLEAGHRHRELVHALLEPWHFVVTLAVGRDNTRLDVSSDLDGGDLGAGDDCAGSVRHSAAQRGQALLAAQAGAKQRREYAQGERSAMETHDQLLPTLGYMLSERWTFGWAHVGLASVNFCRRP